MSQPRDVFESDPNGGGPDGLAGDLGVSSERTGRVRGTPGEVTHGTEEIGPVSNDEPDEEAHSPPDSLPS